MTRLAEAGIFLAVVSAMGWLFACSDEPSSPGSEEDLVPPPEGLVVSDPVPAAGVAAGAGLASTLMSNGDEVAYVSLTPGTVPTGSIATIRRVGDAASVTTAVLDGGFDPVPVGAQAGDLIDVLVRDAGGATILQLSFAVRSFRPPVVVRTNPPRKKTDVPINLGIVVVFSEPVAVSTLTSSSVQLFRGTTPVAGSVSLLSGTATAAVFNPAAPLDPNTDYRLVVTEAVRDLEGDALESAVTVEFTTGTAVVGAASLVAVQPDSATVLIGSQVQLAAVSRDTSLLILTGRPVTWSSEDPAVATVSVTGLVTALAAGVAHIRAEVDGQAAVAVIVVLAEVASVEIVPASSTVPVSGRVKLRAVLRDSSGAVLPFGRVTWQTSDAAVVTLDAASGDSMPITGVSAATATITATSEEETGSATITVVTPVFPYRRLSAGYVHTCGVTSDDWIFCWGGNASRQLGDGTSVGNSSVPRPLAGGVRLSRVSAESYHGCALTSDDAGYCWGDDRLRALGNWTAGGSEYCLTLGLYGPCRAWPVIVTGDLRFAVITVAEAHTCALTPTGSAYCWGNNSQGELGIGTTTGPEDCGTALGNWYYCTGVPTAVAVGQTFVALTAGRGHTCALTGSGTAYCWGQNQSGQLGDGTMTDRSLPAQITGGLAFVALSAGWDHTCGLLADGSAHCWGANISGQLGVGTTTGSVVPVKVAGALSWAAISAGGSHTCGITATGTAYCWGANGSGQLGTGTTESASTTPTPVAAGLTFADLSAGGAHSCGITAAGSAYCWGDNAEGQLGNGSTTSSSVPVRVAGQP